MRNLLILSLTMAGLCAQAAPFDDFKFSTPERLDLKLEASYYSPTSNFDPSGNTYTSFPFNGTYQLADFILGARAQLMKRWHVFGTVDYAAAQSQSAINNPFLPPVTKTQNSFGAAVIGTDYILFPGTFMIIPEISIAIPITTTDRTSQSVANTEGDFETMARVIARIEKHTYRFGAFLGLDYRDRGRSMLVPYGGLAEITFNRWNFGGDLRGYQSITNDTDTTTTIYSYFCVDNGCSEHFAAINPSLLQTDVWVRFNTTPKWAFYVNGSMDLVGSNTSRGWGALAGMIYRWPLGRSSSPGFDRPESTPEFQEAIEDNIDQSQFAPTGSRSMTPSVVPGRRQPPGTVNLQEELNKTEMQIDTKPAKKRDSGE